MLVLRAATLEKVPDSKAKFLIIRSSIYLVKEFDLVCLFVNLAFCFDLCFSEIKMLLLFCSAGKRVLQCIIFRPRWFSEGIVFVEDN